jgi:hypothetical protein
MSHCTDCAKYRQRIRELEQRLAVLDWRPITPENLPKVGDEVFNECEPKDIVRAVLHDWGVGYKLMCNDWRKNGFTHFRAVNLPAKEPHDS